MSVYPAFVAPITLSCGSFSDKYPGKAPKALCHLPTCHRKKKLYTSDNSSLFSEPTTIKQLAKTYV